MRKPSDSKAPTGEGKAPTGEGKAPTGEDKSKTADGVDRRRFFMMGGSAVAAAAVVPLVGSEAVADESQSERVKARYKETDHVKNFYRVNRY